MAKTRPRRGGLVLLALIGALMQPLAAQAQQADVDPLEPVNRRIHGFNSVLDKRVLRPVARGYDRVVPRPVKRGIGNFFDNLSTPVDAVNQFLQGKPKAGLSDVSRFLVNSTIGIGGIFDVASRNGLPRHDEDFGQTFAKWSGSQGPYVVLPFLGPSTVSDAIGRSLLLFVSPLVLLFDEPATRWTLWAVDGIDTRAGLLSAESLVSGDEYLFFRDAYLQRRDYLIDDGRVENDPFLDDF